MTKRLATFVALTTLIFTLSFVALPTETVSAKVADGTYDINYEMKEEGSNNTSIADGYFAKPAKLIVKNGTQHIQLTITSSEWIKSLSGPYGAVDVVSEDKANDQRTVKFKVGDISQPVKMNMHVVVPEEIAGMDYDNEHTARAVFDTSGLPTATEGGDDSNKKGAAGNNGDGTPEENPPTGDNSPVALYALLLVGSLAVIFAIRKARLSRN